MQADCLRILAACAASAGVAFDPIRARRVLSRVDREVKGPWRTFWPERLTEVGEALGFRVVARQGTLAEALAVASPTRPVVVFVPEEGEGDGGEWLAVVGRSGRRVRVAEGADGRPRPMTVADLTRRLGAAGGDVGFAWAALEPLAPCEGARGSVPGHDPHHHAGRSPLSRLLGLVAAEAPDVRAVVVYAAGVGVLTLASPLAVESLVTTVAMSLMVQQLVVISLVLLACLGLAAAMRVMQTYLVEVIQRRVFVRLAADLAYRLPRVRIDAFDREYGPELVNRFFDVLTVQKVAAFLLLDGVSLVLQTLIGLAVLAFYHPYLLGFDLVMVGAMVFTIWVLGRGGVATSVRESRAKYGVAGQLEELARVSRTYKLEGGGELAFDRVDALTRAYIGARRDHFTVVLRQVVFALGFQAVASAALLGLGGWLVIEGQLTLGQLVAAELIVATVAGSFAKLGKHIEGWYDLMAAVEKLGLLLDLPLERDDGEAFPAGVEGAGVRLRGVSYRYPGEARDVLREVDFDVAPGERVALVGSSGAGKSTLADLILGLRAPTRGHVEVDGVNVRDLSLGALRKRVAVVKGAEVIEATVLDNVRLGRASLTAEDVRSALRAAGLWEEVSALPDGLHTRLSSQGAPLSHGQVRRLMLARALAGRPGLLVLDETLDGLDLDSRRRVLDSLFDRSRGAQPTLLVVTHDEAVARLCDQSVVLVDGKAGRSAELAGAPDLGVWLEEARSCRSA